MKKIVYFLLITLILLITAGCPNGDIGDIDPEKLFTITGTVRFDDGAPVAGATILIDYRDTETVTTDGDGNYTMYVEVRYESDEGETKDITAFYSSPEYETKQVTLQRRASETVDFTIIKQSYTESGIAQEGYISEVEEVKWYKINALAGQIVKVDLTQHVSPVDPSIHFYKAGETDALWNVKDSNGGDAPTNLTSGYRLIETDGDYYVSVRDDRDDESNSGVPFIITISIINNPDSSEPLNDTREAGTKLQNGVWTNGYIATIGDYDWFSFDAYNGNIVTIELTMPPNTEGVDPQVVFYPQYDDSYIWYTYDSNGADGPSSLLSPNLLIDADGTYYIKVEDRSNDEASLTTSYALKVTVINNPDANDPQNNERTGAVQLSSGTASSGFIASKGDLDWFKINAYEGNIMQIELSMDINNGGVDPQVVLYPQYSDSYLWYTYDSNGADAPTFIASPNLLMEYADTYMIKVEDRGGDEFSTTVPYSLTVRVLNNPDGSREPSNNEKTGAVALSNGSWDGGYIATKGDTDWYWIYANGGDTMRIEVNMDQNSDGVDPQVVLYPQYSTSYLWYTYDSNGADAPTSLSHDYSVPSYDKYYIKIEDRGGDEYSTSKFYGLKVTINP